MTTLNSPWILVHIDQNCGYDRDSRRDYSGKMLRPGCSPKQTSLMMVVEPEEMWGMLYGTPRQNPINVKLWIFPATCPNLFEPLPSSHPMKKGSGCFPFSISYKFPWVHVFGGLAFTKWRYTFMSLTTPS